MFLILQMPFSDLRSEGVGANERMPRPDWRSDQPEGFIRRFGRVRRRHQGARGLQGERNYATIDSAIRFREAIRYAQPEWGDHLNINGWYRRLYFDGVIGGRFEIGFSVDTSRVRNAGYNDNLEIDIDRLVKTWLRAQVEIEYPNGLVEPTRLGDCAKHLSQAYLIATTSNDGMMSTDIATLYGQSFRLGQTLAYVRLFPTESFVKSRAQRQLSQSFDAKHHLSDVRISNTDVACMIVESTVDDAYNETRDERAARVIFSHLHGLAFAASCLTQLRGTKESSAKIRPAVEQLLRRLKEFGDGLDGDEPTPGLTIFSEAYDGRLAELASGIEALSKDVNKPSFFERAKQYAVDIQNLAIKTAVETTLKQALKSGGA